MTPLDTLERLREQLRHDVDDLRLELVPRVLVPEGERRLGEDRARVQLGIHAVEREADVRLAVAYGPRHRAWPPVARQQRRVSVHHAEPRYREGVGWNLPGKPEAEDQVGLEPAKERRDSVTSRGNHDVELRWRISHVLQELA